MLSNIAHGKKKKGKPFLPSSCILLYCTLHSQPDCPQYIGCAHMHTHMLHIHTQTGNSPYPPKECIQRNPFAHSQPTQPAAKATFFSE